MNLFRLVFFIAIFISPCFSDEAEDRFRMGGEHAKVDRLARVKLREISAEIAKKFNLPLDCGAGIGRIVEDKTITWSSKYIVQGHQLTLEEMRPVIVNAVQHLWQRVQSEKLFHEYQQYVSFFSKKNIPLSLDFFAIRIDLWDENNDRYLYPYLSQVIFKQGKIYYRYADPDTQALQMPGVIEDFTL